jgi:hypothetical protein
MRGLVLGVPAILAAVSVPGLAAAAEDGPRERQITTGEIENWLEAEPGSAPADGGEVPPDEAPLPAPREHGLVVESGLGFVSQIGSLKHVTPTAPRFQVLLGYEIFTFLMPFLEGDLVFARTSYATEPPPPRSYFHWGAGAGLRFTVPVGDIIGILAQGSVGLAQVSEQNVLSIYGFPDADEPNLYFGGDLGVEWYQVNPNLALAAHGGLRSYGAGLTRDRGTEPPLAVLGSADLRYAF